MYGNFDGCDRRGCGPFEGERDSMYGGGRCGRGMRGFRLAPGGFGPGGSDMDGGFGPFDGEGDSMCGGGRCGRGMRGFRLAPGGFGPGGSDMDGGFGPMGPGFPPHGGPGRPGFPPHGMPPRRPDPEFLKRRVEDADLAELLDMAGRMVHRRPQGGPARGQALILSILAGRETLSQRELQRMLGIQPGSLSELLSKLEAKGCLTRERAEDRRGNLLRITDAGRAALPEDGDDPEDDPFAPLTPEQQDQLSALLRPLLNAWIDEIGDAPHGPRGQRPVEI